LSEENFFGVPERDQRALLDRKVAGIGDLAEGLAALLRDDGAELSPEKLLRVLETVAGKLHELGQLLVEAHDRQRFEANFLSLSRLLVETRQRLEHLTSRQSVKADGFEV
jgi:hypothetical protein